MKTLRSRRAVLAASAALIMAGATSSALAEVADYEFQLVQPPCRKGETMISVRLRQQEDRTAGARRGHRGQASGYGA